MKTAETDKVHWPLPFFDCMFRNQGFMIRMVGGAVRDQLLGVEPHDMDFCTDATPEQMKAVVINEGIKNLHIIETGIQHGTLTFVTDAGAFEITTLRKDVECDGR